MGIDRRGNLPTAKRTNTEAQDLINDVLPPVSTFDVEKGRPPANMAALAELLEYCDKLIQRGEGFTEEDKTQFEAEITV